MNLKKITSILGTAVYLIMSTGSFPAWAEDTVQPDPVLQELLPQEAFNQNLKNPPAPAQNLPPAEKETGEKKQANYKVQAGDRIFIKIYPEDEYVKGGEMQVSSEGNITLPLVGKFEIAKKTIAQAEKELVKIIDQDYLVNPEVVIEIKEYAEKSKATVIVLGQVRKPGTYDIPPDRPKLTLLELISLAGGFTEIANIKKIKVIRTQNGKKESKNVNAEAVINGSDPDLDLVSGDVVNVSESLF